MVELSIQNMLGDMELVDFLLRCRVDFRFFCNKVLGDWFQEEYGGLKDYHLEWFTEIQNNSRVIIRAPSGFSKTTLIFAYAVWIAFNYKNKNIMMVSNTIPQAKIAFEKMKDIIENNELLKELKPVNPLLWSSEQIKTTTGCRIFLRPYSPNIKGVRVDIAILDEMDSYEKPEIFFDYVVPRLNPDAKIIGISTPEPGARLMDQIVDKKLTTEGGGPYKMITSYAIIDPEDHTKRGDFSTGVAIWPERFSIEKLKLMKAELGEQYFEKNFMCNTKAEPEKAIFRLSQILKGYDDTLSFTTDHEGPIFIGCDFAYSANPKADYDAFVVVEKKNNFIIIKTIEMYRGLLAPAKIDRIKDLVKTYDPISVVCDKSNLGSVLIDELRGLGIPVVEQDFSSVKRKDLLKTLQNIIDSGKLVIPRDPEVVDITNTLTEQLMGFKREKSPVTQIEIPRSTSVHDDLVMALAMAVKDATEMQSASIDGTW